MSGDVWPGMVNCEKSGKVDGELVWQVVSGASSRRIDGSGVEHLVGGLMGPVWSQVRWISGLVCWGNLRALLNFAW